MKLIDEKQKIYLLENFYFDFPSLDMMGGDLVAVGGNLHPHRIINAYYSGIFPWFMDDHGWIHWFSPKKRMVLRPHELRVTKSLKRTVKNKGFVVKTNENFEKVIQNCATIKRDHEDSSWINNDFMEAYTELFHLGYAYSIETYLDGELVGGLYGLMIGNIFCGESMFSKVKDASKVAFYHLCNQAQQNEIELIDCQVYNPHLESLGAYEIDREEYFELLQKYST
ncbi:MAG: leucyl/phenylalanyl-tRNA--protein transferase [Campylobacterales bacterium]|nr:leucyl/phenylalanyl-tRNA--protein transferase [Campylobacterales bacterium]